MRDVRQTALVTVALLALGTASAHANITLQFVPQPGNEGVGTLVLEQSPSTAQLAVSLVFDPDGPLGQAPQWSVEANVQWDGLRVILAPLIALDTTGREWTLTLGPIPIQAGSSYPQQAFGHTEFPNGGGISVINFGGWSDNAIVVPEPSTYFAGALVLLPMAAQALRIVRKQRVA